MMNNQNSQKILLLLLSVLALFGCTTKSESSLANEPIKDQLYGCIINISSPDHPPGRCELLLAPNYEIFPTGKYYYQYEFIFPPEIGLDFYRAEPEGMVLELSKSPNVEGETETTSVEVVIEQMENKNRSLSSKLSGSIPLKIKGDSLFVELEARGCSSLKSIPI